MILQSFESTVYFFLKTAPLVVLSIYVMSYVVRKSYLTRLKIRKIKLNTIALTTFTLSFFNTVVAYSFLSQAWRERRIDDREVIALSLLISFPSVFNHLYSFFIPFVIPILGFLGLIYTCLRLTVALLKTTIGYLMIEKGEGRIEFEGYESKLHENVFRILMIMFLTYFVVDLAYRYGIFNILTERLIFLPINPSSLTIALITLFNVRSAIVLTANLVEKGLSYRWALIGLLLGNVISFSIRSAKHSLPLHLSLFGSFGIKIVLINSLITFLLDLAIIALLLIV